MARFSDFLRAFFAEWSFAMSGPFSIPLAVIGILSPNEIAKVVLLAMSLICLVVASFLIWRRERLRALDAKPRLDILYEPDESRFVERERFNLDWLTRRLSVCVRNTGKLQANNCQVFFDKITPNEGTLVVRIPLMDAPFVLNGSEERFIPLVSFEERERASGERPTAGTLHVPFSLKPKDGERTFDATQEYTVMLRATATECGPCTRSFRFWVDNLTLKMERIE